MANNFLQTLLSPEVAMPMAQALMGNQGNMANFGNALGAYGTAQAQRAGQNKTLEYFRQNAPEFAAMVESGMPMDQAWQTYAKQRYAQQADPYLSVGGKIFNKQDQSWLSPPSDPNAAPETGLVPQMMKDEQGNTIFVQPTKDGRLVRSQVPEGFQPYDPYSKAYETNRGQALGKAEGEAAAAAPADMQAAQNALDLLDSIRTDPYLDRGVGGTSVGNVIWGTGGYDFQNKVDQAKSGAFLSAIQQMRGMGSLSNAEGSAATQAVTRMNTATSKEAFLAALDDYEKIVRQGYDRAASRAGGSQPLPQAGGKRLRFNPATGELE